MRLILYYKLTSSIRFCFLKLQCVFSSVNFHMSCTTILGLFHPPRIKMECLDFMMECLESCSNFNRLAEGQSIPVNPPVICNVTSLHSCANQWMLGMIQHMTNNQQINMIVDHKLHIEMMYGVGTMQRSLGLKHVSLQRLVNNSASIIFML